MGWVTQTKILSFLDKSNNENDKELLFTLCHYLVRENTISPSGFTLERAETSRKFINLMQLNFLFVLQDKRAIIGVAGL